MREGAKNGPKYSFRKEKAIQNVLKRKNMYFAEKIAKYVHLGLFYVLDYSGCFDMHIEK